MGSNTVTTAAHPGCQRCMKQRNHKHQQQTKMLTAQPHPSPAAVTPQLGLQQPRSDPSHQDHRQDFGDNQLRLGKL